MSCKVKWALNKVPRTEDKNLSIMSVVEVRKARTFHEGVLQYRVTPLADLKNVAEYLDLVKACVKDKSCRFGLNTFKVLDGSYVIARYIVKETRRDISQVPYSVLTSRRLRNKFDQATFFSTTDGSYGRGVAWATSHLGQKCVVRMPMGSTENRCHHIEDENAECTIEKVNYDNCVRMVVEEIKHAERGMIIQDTAWEDCRGIPFWTMQDYSTMADEAVEQFEERPTHVFVRAGIGSLTGGVVGYFANEYKKNPPVMVVVEAELAACLYKGAEAADGEIRIIDGEAPTVTAGLCCGESNITSQGILKNHVTAFLAVGDDVVRRGMCMLAAPFKGDPQITSGESGAVTFGTLVTVMKDEVCRGLRLELGLDQDSKILVFSTEGDTDPDHYKTIVWESGLK